MFKINEQMFIYKTYDVFFDINTPGAKFIMPINKTDIDNHGMMVAAFI